MRMMINDDGDTTIIQNLHDGPSLQMSLLYSINTERTNCDCLAIELVDNEDETAAPSVCTVYSIVGVMQSRVVSLSLSLSLPFSC